MKKQEKHLSAPSFSSKNILKSAKSASPQNHQNLRNLRATQNLRNPRNLRAFQNSAKNSVRNLRAFQNSAKNSQRNPRAFQNLRKNGENPRAKRTRWKQPPTKLVHRRLSYKLAATYSPTLSCSTIGAHGLNCSVRNGKRCAPWL